MKERGMPDMVRNGRSSVGVLLLLLLGLQYGIAQSQVKGDHDVMDEYRVVAPTPSVGSFKTFITVIGGAAILTGITLRYDQEIADALISWKEQNSTVGAISPIVTEMGSGGFAIGVLGGVGTYGYLVGDARAIEVGRLGLTSFMATGFAVQVIKHLSGRERPETSTRRGGFWHGPFGMYRQPDGATKKGIGSFDAFASGHTATAFSVATTFAEVYEDDPWVGYVSYTLASAVAVSRITERTHWLSDCILGAAIGVYGTQLVRELMYSSQNFVITPDIYYDGYGLCLRVGL